MNNNRKLQAICFTVAAICAILVSGVCIAAEPLRFHADGKYIRDQHGRVVMFRGANLGQCYYTDGIGFTEENLIGLKNYGFNFIRLNLGWDFLEPEKGKYDVEKMRLVKEFIQKASEYGIYTMPDFHQMLWEAHIPRWMRDESLGHDYLSEMSAVAVQQSDRFWESQALQDDLIGFLVYIAKNLKDTPGLFGYDLFNEPFSIKGTSYAIFEKCCLYPFYDKAIVEVRKVDPAAPIILEPQPQTIVLPAYTRPFADSNIVWSPHVYFPHSYGPSGLIINREETPEDVQKKYKRFEKNAETMGVPWLVGEYGGDPVSKKFAGPWLMENMRLQDRYFVGSAIWSFNAKGGGGWNINSDAKTLHPHMAEILHRPYPQYTAGTPEKLMYEPESKTFRFKYISDSKTTAPTEIYYPRALFEKSDMTITTECVAEKKYDSATEMLVISTSCDKPVEIKIEIRK